MAVMIALAGFAGVPARGAKRLAPAGRIAVCVAAGGDTTALHRAQSLAAQMFREIAVHIEWHNGECAGRILCAAPIVLTIHASSRLDLHPGWLAYSLPFEGTHAGIFLDRVQQMVPPPTVPYVLAHVLVHELTHMLEGTSRHEHCGVMKRYWDASDYAQMQRKALLFSSFDVALIHQGIEARARRPAGTASGFSSTLVR